MPMRIRISRCLPRAFVMLMRAFVLFVLVGLAGTSTAHAHQTEVFTSVAVQTSGMVLPDACCHVADQGGQHADCALSMCCSLSALPGNGGRDIRLAAAFMRPLIGPMGVAGRSHPPFLHPPTAT
ncbi:hypothetical protein [Roseinatronobacter alkalisoli]|uniref:CopL family metal-binding regulatory protein n=1 Tax=Roseinatronobacter alkalisoli TaxID=3028235 RepID=A0ABT5T6Q3_9RHOB|nr:hypothetical protein [Roseinatronobacter sp. HJB301]MDD7970796.1 hypothetical protein [Roseinatronobacter sp. HJB301]